MTSLIQRISNELENHGFLATTHKIIQTLFARLLGFVDRLFDRSLKIKMLKDLVDGKSRKLANTFSTQEGIKDNEYKKYIEIQIIKSFKSSSYLRFWRFWGRTGLIERLNTALGNQPRLDLAILCVGCRDTRELKNVKKICGLRNITGLDLFSGDPRIKVGDMHAMPFEDDQFDILISVDNLEHAYDPAKALSEFRRVVKRGGIIGIEVPVNHQPNETDRHDYSSAENLINLAGLTDLSAIIFQERIKGPQYEKMRILVRNP